MTSNEPGTREIDFYVHDFLRVLRRFRLYSVLGWITVLLGAGGVLVGWSHGRPHGLLDVLLSGLVVLAGLLVVNQAVLSLQSYLRVPFDPDEEGHPAIVAVRGLMREIDEGGWWEANAGIRQIEQIAERHHLWSPPGGTPGTTQTPETDHGK